ncbi:hypothetical protein JYT11_00120 [Planctomycetaceae bacterium AH-315-I19]|nr:hypothetical protein [Planctomycetaceae bacterium AH-315-I19]
MFIERIAIAVAALLAALTPAADAADWITFSGNDHVKAYDIAWPGGTLSDFLNGLDETSDDSIITSREASGINLQPFSAQKMRIYEAMEIMTSLISGIEFSVQGGDVHSQLSDQDVFRRPVNYIVSISPGALEHVRAERSRFDLSFDGGTVASYVRAIQKAAGEKKIVVMPEAEALEVPRVELTGVTLYEAIDLIAHLSRVDIFRPKGALVIRSWPSVLENSPVDKRSERVDSNTWSVEGIMSTRLTESDLLSAIDAAITLADGETRVRFHKETGLLMARGPESELALISKIIDKVRESAHQRMAGPDYRSLIRHQEIEIQERRIKQTLAKSHLEFAVEKLDEATKLHEEGFLETLRLSEIRLEVRQAEAELRMAALRVEEAERKLESYKKSAENQGQR